MTGWEFRVGHEEIVAEGGVEEKREDWLRGAGEGGGGLAAASWAMGAGLRVGDGSGSPSRGGVVEVGLEGGEGEGGGLGGEDGFALAEVLTAGARSQASRTGDLVEGEEDEGSTRRRRLMWTTGTWRGAEEAEKATGGHAPRGHLFDEGLDGDEALIGLGIVMCRG